MSPRRKLLWRLFPCFLLIAIATIWITRVIDGAGALSAGQTVSLAILAVSATLAGFALIWNISRSLQRTREGARRFAEGDLGFRLDVPDSEELGGLAETLNQMARQLDERISTINQQRNEQDAILSSMMEGVVAMDHDYRILQVNRAAEQVLELPPGGVISRVLHEVIRNRELQQLVETTVDEGRSTEGEIEFHGADDRLLQIHVTPLQSASGARIGALLVLNDVTRLRRLERVRRDFVANVSHELKTPLTSIKGYVETLLDGAIEQPDEARRFCSIILRQVDRLQAIIEDLLSISRIEQEIERDQVVTRRCVLREILETAMQAVSHQANEKNIRVQLECEPGIEADINPSLIEQVAVNLIDNAIKYSEPDREVVVRVLADEPFWKIQFIDQGCGIDAAHLPRIFERFYRVDKARSRKAGGTGLGLSIVKHIVTAHRGKVLVESIPGKGSVFTVCLPRHA